MVKIHTGDQKRDGTKSPILFTVIGTKGRGQTKIITEKGFKAGKDETVEVYSTNVGKITGFMITLTEKDTWVPEKITIVNVCKYIVILDTKEKKEFNLDKLVITPENSPYVYLNKENKGIDNNLVFDEENSVNKGIFLYKVFFTLYR